MSAASARVALGAAFLDERDPEWWRLIDLGTLDLESADMCVLGQRCPLNAVAESPDWVHHGFDAMALTLGTFGDREQVNEWAAPLGFQVFLPGGAPCDCADERACEQCIRASADYRELTDEWRRVIAGRRSAA